MWRTNTFLKQFYFHFNKVILFLFFFVVSIQESYSFNSMSNIIFRCDYYHSEAAFSNVSKFLISMLLQLIFHKFISIRTIFIKVTFLNLMHHRNFFFKDIKTFTQKKVLYLLSSQQMCNQLFYGSDLLLIHHFFNLQCLCLIKILIFLK